MPSFPTTFPELLDTFVRDRGDRVFLPRRTAQDHSPISFGRLAADVDALAAALLDLGIRRGDRVGIVAENRYEWLLIDLSLASLGAVDVPRGSDTTPTELRFILEHSGSCAAFAENDKVARDLVAMQGDLAELRHVIVMADATGVEGALALGDLVAKGELARDQSAAALRDARGAVQPADLLTIVYTSGTTAEPKGVMLSHANVLSNMSTCSDVLHFTDQDTFLSVLPAWHMYERIMDYLALAAGGQLIYTDRRRIKEDLKAIRPTIFAAVPRIWEMLHDGVVNTALKLPGLQGKLFRRCLAISRKVGAGTATLADRVQFAVLDRVVNKTVRAGLGGRLRLCASGGGALPRHVDETFLGMGIPLRNGYGLTETSPVAAIRLPHQTQPGHIGPPLPETQVEARKDDGSACGPNETGVLWIKGPQVMSGYYRNPSRTAEVLTEDGWFNSGDLGHCDEHGNLWITGRAKDTIVLAGGENVEPEPIETLIKTSPLIEQAVVVGQDEKALGVLIVPSADALEHEIPKSEWDAQGDALQGDGVKKLFRAELDRLVTRENGCRPTDRIATLQVLAEGLTPDNGLLTQTLKVRRHVVAERYAELIAALFRRD
ncbi:MAG: long-chain fatty acid--CoA ligase [Planctomycetota bacterium]|nr:long-chain fatty acid--CoA ligase [Planctomycetota bacterium]